MIAANYQPDHSDGINRAEKSQVDEN